MHVMLAHFWSLFIDDPAALRAESGFPYDGRDQLLQASECLPGHRWALFQDLGGPTGDHISAEGSRTKML